MPETKEGKLRAGAGVPLTSRRWFVAATSFAAVSLYGLWGWLGEAPLPFGHGPAAAGGDHGDHGGHGGGGGPTPEEFRQRAEAFIARHRLPDGSVAVAAGSPPAAMAGDGHGEHRGPSDAAALPDVYILASRFAFEPDVVRLAVGQIYRFRFMAVDVSHGAAIQLGGGSRILRLPAATQVEREFGFAKPGEYLLYCTVFCGVAHHRMSGRLIVA